MSHIFNPTESGTGPQGPQGPIGPPGEPGPEGPTGDPGPPGAAGAQGTPGTNGADGVQGVPGPEGESGTDGEPGPPGQMGATGATGATGTQGIQGVPGPLGPQGDDGENGDPGPPGVQGDTGATGATGAQGIQGVTGGVVMAPDNEAEDYFPIPPYTPYIAYFPAHGPHRFGSPGLGAQVFIGDSPASTDEAYLVLNSGASTSPAQEFKRNGVIGLSFDLAATFSTPRILYNALLDIIDINASNLNFGLTAGRVYNYRSITTVGNGVPAEYAEINLVTQAASLGGGAGTSNALLHAVPAAGVGIYRISWYLKVTRAATSSSILGPIGFTWTDGTDSVVQLVTGMGQVASGAAATTVTTNSTTSTLTGTYILWAASSTNISYGVTYSSTGATTMQYEVHIKLERLG